MNKLLLSCKRRLRALLSEPSAAALCGLLILVLFVSCGKAPMAPPQQAMPVPVMTVSEESIPQTSEYVAKLISRHSVTLQPQITGTVSAIYVKAGDRVQKGAPLIQINPLKQEATLASTIAEAAAARTQIEQARQNLNVAIQQQQAAQSNVAFNQQQYQRYKTLYEQNYVSRQDLDRYADSYNQAVSQLHANEATINAQRAALASAERTYQQNTADVQAQQAELGYYNIRAPFSGVVGDIPIKLGNFVQPLTPLLSVTENSPLEANISVPANRAVALKDGLPVQLLDSANTVLATPKISFISPQVDTATQTILVKAILQNTDGKFRADQIVDARIIWEQEPGILIPTSSVSHVAGLDFVMVAVHKDKDYVASQRPVKLGPIVGTNYVVLDGLKPGEEIITGGIQKIRDGAPILPQAPKK